MFHSHRFSMLFLTAAFLFLTRGLDAQENPWQCIGPDMGYINDLAMDLSHPDTLYAATPYGVYKSVDMAGHWVKTFLDGVNIESVRVAPSDPESLLAHSDTAVYLSTDGGGNWLLIYKSADNHDIGAVAFDPADANDIWVGVDVGGWRVYEDNLFHSTNGGLDWTGVPFHEGEELKLASVEDIRFDPSNPSVMYVLGYGDTYHSDGGLFVSQDRGATWTNYRPGGCSSNNVVAIASTREGYEPHATYILVNACNIDLKTFKSLDYGSTWEEFWAPFDAVNQRWAGTSMCVDRDSPEFVFVGGRDQENQSSVFYYNTETEGWYAWLGTPHSHPTAILSHPEGNFLGFFSHGVYQNAYPENTWVQKNKGMHDSKVLDVVTYPGDPQKLLIAIDGSLAKTNDGGTSWQLTASSFSRLAMVPGDTGQLLAGKKVSNMTFMTPFSYYSSTNGGASWESHKLFTNSGLMDYYYTMWLGDFLVHPDNPETILIGIDGGPGCGEGLYCTTDNGASWDDPYSTGVSALAMDPVNHDIVYLGTTGSGYVGRSENRGDSWTRISPGGGDAFVNSVRDLEVDHLQRVFAATSSGMYRWDGDENWTQLEGFPEDNTPALFIDRWSAGREMYAGTEHHGVMVSSDGGSTWESFNHMLGSLSITRLTISEGDPRYLYAGTEDGALWRTELPQDSGVRVPAEHTSLSLSVWPNPGQGTFFVSLGDGAAENGTLRVISLTGEVLCTQETRGPETGSTITLHLENLSPGCYLLQYGQGGQTTTRKILIHP